MTIIRKALVVDDDADILRVCQVCLEMFANWRVAVAASADAAVAAASRELPDVILLDVMMPETDGFSLLTRLKATAATARIPVVLMTAAEVGAERWRTSGAVGLIAKPFDPVTLGDQIARLLRGSEGS